MPLRTSLPLTTSVAIASLVTALATAPPAAADGGGGVIRGTVLETGRVIAPGIDVSLYATSGEFVSATVTNSQAGAYEFAGLKAGSYTLWFENQNEAVSEWYDNQPDKPQATPITLGAGTTYVANAYLTQVSENLVAPTVSGTAAVGSTLTATRGTWFPTQSVEFRYQWLRGGTAIDGATASTYALRDVDSGSRISVEVIAVHQGATETARSTPTATVTGGTPPAPTIGNTTAPSVTGATTVGSVLSATSGSWSPADATVTLQWLRGEAVVGSGTTYTTSAADVGATLRVRASATKSGWTGATSDSAAFGPIVQPSGSGDPVDAPTSAGLPTISGTARVGSALTASPGTWTGTPTGLSFQWTRDGAPIAGATSPTLALTATDAGRAIAVAVTATNAGGSATASATARLVARATSRLSAALSSTRKGQLKAAVTLSSAGARTGRVVLTVRVQGRTTKKVLTLRAGVGKVTVRGLRKGRATVTVRYAGDTSTAAAAATKKVSVR